MVLAPRASSRTSCPVHSHRPCSGWTTTSGDPDPWSNTVPSVAKRLAGFQHVGNPLHRLSLAAEAEERLALEVEHLLFRQRRRMREVAAGEDPRQLAADHRVVIADPPRAPGEVHAELQRREHAFAADADGLPR